MNADETSAHHRQPAGTSTSRNQLCFVLETGWGYFVSTSSLRSLPCGASLSIVQNLLQISRTNVSIAGFFLIYS